MAKRYQIFWPLCCLFFYDLQILITPLVSFGHCIFCSSMIYRFWLSPWYLLGIVLSVLLWFTDSDYTLGIFWPLCCLFFYDIQILITPLVSFGHCVVCSSMIYRFWLHPWYILAIVLSVLLWYTDPDYTLGIFWPLCCLFFYDIQILITPWYLLVIVLSVLLWYTDSDYTLGIFSPLCCLVFYDIQILITPLVSFGHCIVCFSMIHRFWLPPWYLLAIVFSVLLWYTDSDYPLGIFWPLCCLFFYDIQILITPFVSFGHCAVCSSMIYRFWLHLWYLLVISSSMIYRFWLHPWCLSAIVLSVFLWFRDCDYPLGIFWPLCCLFSYELWILITPLVSFGHCVFCSSMIYRFWLHPWYLLAIFSSMIYRFWLHPCYLLAIVLSILLWLTDSDYPLGIIWPLCCVFFYDIPILIIPLVSFDHCVVCSSMIYRFWLHPWYILAIGLSVLLWYTDSDYPLGIFWPLCCLFFYDIKTLITPLVSFGHCVVWSSMIYRFWLPLGIFWPLCCLFFYDIQILITPWYLLAIVLSDLLWYTDSDYPLGIFWQLCCLFFYDIQILITPWYLLVTVLSFLLWFTDSDYTLGIFWPLCCLFFYDIQILIIPLVSFGHSVVCSSMTYRFWLHPWYILAIVLSVLLWYTDSDYTLGIFWPLCFLFFYDIQILITPWYLLVIVLSVLLLYTDSDYPLGIFWPLCFLFFYGIQILITPLVSFGHCVVCSSMIYRFWLTLWYLLAIVLFVLLWYIEIWLHPCYLLAIVLSVLLWYTDSDYPLGIFWPLCCLFFYDIQILITPLVSFGHCVVCFSMIYRFSLPPWYLLAIVLSVLLWYTDSDYPLGIFWPLCCLFFYDIQILITPLVSFGHCAVCSSMIYRFWLHPWYLLVICSSMIYRFWLHLWYLSAIVLSVLLWFRDGDYPLGIFWPLCCQFSYELWILITPLVSFGHCVFCSSMIYRFWLHPCYVLSIVLSVRLWYTDSDYPLVSFGHCVVCSSMIYRFWLPLGIFWPLCCLFLYDIQILISPLVSFGHCVVCSSMTYGFLFPSWYLLAIVFSVLLWFTDSEYPLVSFGHCVVCSSMIYRFWLHPWYLLAIVLSVLLWHTDSEYPLVSFGHCVVCSSMIYRNLITPLLSFGHCVVCSSMIYRFWLHPWYLLTIVLSGLLWYTDSDYPLVSFGHCVVCSSMIYRFWLHPWYLLAIVFSVLLWYTDSDYTLGIFWSLCCLFFYDIQILITPLVSFGHQFFYDIQILITPLVSFGHCVVCSSMILGLWLPPWYLLAIVLCVLLWYIEIWLHPCYLLAIVLSVLLWYTDSDYTLGIFWPSFLLWYTDSDYTLVIFWPLCCLFFYDIQILITPLVSFGHCVVCSSMIYRFWLHPWYLLVIVLSVLLWYTDSDYTFGIFWSSVLLWYTDSDYTIGLFRPLCCLFFYDIQILINPLVYFGHCVVCSSMIYRFWIPPWYPLAIVLSVLLWYIEIWLHPCYLLAILLSVLLWYTDSDYTLGIFWPLCCLVFYAIQILITPLVSFGHCVFCSSMIYRFWLPLGIFWPLCCLFFYDIQILITPLVSFGHCVFCSSMIYRFWLPLGIFWPLCFLFFYDIQILITPWYLLAIVLSVLLWYTDSDYTLGIFWPLCCLFFYDIQILITPLVSFGHCAVCSSMIYRFWLHLWYLLVISSSMIYRFWLHPWCLSAIVLSVLLWYTDSDYPLGIF